MVTGHINDDCNSYRSMNKLPYPRTCKICGLGPCKGGFISNNAPAVVLDLTDEEARFLMDNCNANITLGLQLLQGTAPDQRATAERLVAMMERFKVIREKLIKQGVKANETEDKSKGAVRVRAQKARST